MNQIDPNWEQSAQADRFLSALSLSYQLCLDRNFTPSALICDFKVNWLHVFFLLVWGRLGFDRVGALRGRGHYSIRVRSFPEKLTVFPMMVRPFNACGRPCMFRSFCQIIVYFSAVSSQLHSNAAVIAFVGFKMSPVCPQLKPEVVAPHFDQHHLQKLPNNRTNVTLCAQELGQHLV